MRDSCLDQPVDLRILPIEASFDHRHQRAYLTANPLVNFAAHLLDRGMHLRSVCAPRGQQAGKSTGSERLRRELTERARHSLFRHGPKPGLFVQLRLRAGIRLTLEGFCFCHVFQHTPCGPLPTTFKAGRPPGSVRSYRAQPSAGSPTLGSELIQSRRGNRRRLGQGTALRCLLRWLGRLRGNRRWRCSGTGAGCRDSWPQEQEVQGTCSGQERKDRDEDAEHPFQGSDLRI